MLIVSPFIYPKKMEIYKRGVESEQNCLTHEQYLNEAIYTCIWKEKRMEKGRNRKRYISDGSEFVILYINQNIKVGVQLKIANHFSSILIFFSQ